MEMSELELNKKKNVLSCDADQSSDSIEKFEFLFNQCFFSGDNINAQ